MFDRFWDDFWRVLGDFGTTSGGPGRVLEASSSCLFGRVVPKGSQRAIFEDSIFGGFGLNCLRISRILEQFLEDLG